MLIVQPTLLFERVDEPERRVLLIRSQITNQFWPSNGGLNIGSQIHNPIRRRFLLS
jgi:hypothetical protein